MANKKPRLARGEDYLKCIATLEEIEAKIKETSYDDKIRDILMVAFGRKKGYTIEEIAEQMHCSVSTVRDWLHQVIRSWHK